MTTSTYTKDEAKAADAILAELTNTYFDTLTNRERAVDALHYAAGDTRTRYGWKMDDDQALAAAAVRAANEMIIRYNRESYARAIAAYQPAVTAVRVADAAINAHEEAQYRGWQRFFLVQDGHIHASRSCGSLRITTKIGWLPQLSGETEADAVAAHGAMLCTKCFPSAPVEFTRGKDAPADQCPGSGERIIGQASRTRTPYGECAHCHTSQVVTMYGVTRKHKLPKK